MPEGNPILSVNVADLPWRSSTMASGVFVKDIAVTDVHSETGCVFVLVDRA